MLKRLRIQFILTNTLYVSIVLVIVFIIICVISYNKSVDSLNDMLMERAAHPQSGEKILLDAEKEFDSVEFMPSILILPDNSAPNGIKIIEYGAYMEPDAIEEAYALACQKAEATGRLSGSLCYVRRQTEEGPVVAIANISYIKPENTELILMLVLIGVCSILLVTAVSFPVSKVALLSTKNAWEQQKRFIADASHALKTPLTVILANISILKSRRPDDETMRWLASTEEEANSMHTLIHEMLVLAQSDLNVRRTDFTNVNLSVLLTGLILQFEALAFDKRIRLETNVQDSVEMRGNEKALTQMFSAIIENAFKYEKEGGLVRIRLEKQVRKTIFSVYNASTYISPDERERIFDRFCRLKNQETRAREGHGLGLSVARSVADAHQATIDVDSAEQTGTEFRVTFRHIL